MMYRVKIGQHFILNGECLNEGSQVEIKNPLNDYESDRLCLPSEYANSNVSESSTEALTIKPMAQVEEITNASEED